MTVKIEKMAWKGWPNCYHVANGEVDLIVTSDVGPRIMRYGFMGGQNFFVEFPKQLGGTGEPDWQPRGGHRIWLAPEDPVLSYAPDNSSVEVAIDGDHITLTQRVEELTGMRKQVAVRLAPNGSEVEVIHRITNTNSRAVEWAPWALSMMAQGGMGIHPLPAKGTHPEVLAPATPLVLWTFTDLSDPRWKITSKYLLLRQDPNATTPQKAGTFHSNTVGAYLLGSELFVKRFHAPGSSRAYPDMGCSYETFTNAAILELETLGPLTRLEPGATVEHTEQWSLHRGVTISGWTDDEIDRALAGITT